MKLHIFNPEHDIALAHDNPYFTAPHAGRQLRADLGFLPAVWAEDGDMVLVDDVESSMAHVRHLGNRAKDVVFVTMKDLKHTPFAAPMPLCGNHGGVPIEIVPWGWDSALVFQLRKSLVDECYLLGDRQLADIRQLSDRRFAAGVLSRLKECDGRFVGDGFYATSLEEIERYLESCSSIVIKAPWSSSGRGIRYITAQLSDTNRRWIDHTIAQQGGVMVEPFYYKVKDFAMEFYADGTHVDYLGLSIFETARGAYTGNVLASEDLKRKALTKFLSDDLLDCARLSLIHILTPLLENKYRGPLGVDMMVVSAKGEESVSDVRSCRLHPCVEVNLRRTMGHVSLSLIPSLPGMQEMMCINYENTRYHLRIIQLQKQLNTNLI